MKGAKTAIRLGELKSPASSPIARNAETGVRNCVLKTAGVLGCVGLLLLFRAPAAAAQWTQGAPGRVWVKSALFWQRTNEEFDVVGERRERIDGGEADSRALFTDIIVGALPTLDIWLQVPFYDLRFTNIALDAQSVGFGDIRAFARWRVANLGGGSTPVALRAGAKAPIGSAPVDVNLIPLGEGQWDLEFFSEIGHSFWPFPAYAELWLGYRVRFANATTGKDPGGEFVFLTEAGVNPTSGTLVKVTLDGFIGRNWIVEGVQTSSNRRIITLQLVGGARVVSPVWGEAGVRVPLSGRNFPAGAQLIVGVSGAFRLGR